MKQENKLVLIILDGWGLAPPWGGNAIALAETPVMNNLWRKYPHSELKAAEEWVGLPRHEPGNSEVGHLNIGCGQVVHQNLPGITQTINDGTFFKNPVLVEAMNNVKRNNSYLHLLGLVSDGGIHAYNGHLYALLQMAKQQGIGQVYIHMITDGRDTDQMKALSYLSELRSKIKEYGVGQIVSIMGRYWAMDRDKHWDRIQKAYDCIVSGVAPMAATAEQAISENYRLNKLDEFIEPTIINNQVQPYVPLSENDSLIFFNYRADRARQITDALVGKDFKDFSRRKIINNLYFATFAFLDNYIENDKIKTVFHLNEKNYPLAKIISENNLRQFHIAETEKYAHVTYFFNGGREEPFDHETRIMIPSPKVPTFDLMPQMSADYVTDHLLSSFHSNNFSVCNFANADMVGHTGNIKAAVSACETLDTFIGKIILSTQKAGFYCIVTADHGNAEQMLNPATGEKDSEHTINPVPFILIPPDDSLVSPLVIPDGYTPSLQDIAPTILKIMNLPQPTEMTGKPLV